MAYGAPNIARVKSASGTNATLVVSTPAQILFWYFYNNTASVKVIHFYDSATIPTAGAGTPLAPIVIPPNGGMNVPIPIGLPFAAGIGYTITGGIPDTDTTGVAVEDVDGFFLWK